MGNDRFALAPEAVDVLTNPDSLFFAGGGVMAVMTLTKNVSAFTGCFQTGLGLAYDTLGVDCALGLDQMGGGWKRQKLVQDVLPMLDGVMEKLEQGALVAHIGCGPGTGAMVMASAFPQSTFHGFDTSRHAVHEAHQRSLAAGLANVFWHHLDDEPLPQDQRFDFITTHDVVHATTHPLDFIKAVYQAIKPNGIWYLTDIAGRSSFEENLRNHPLASMLYAFSVLLCMSSGLSKPGGAGLGTLGFHEAVARQMTREAGFASFRRLAVDDEFNNHYEVRP